ncbi:MAG: hypothetical protein JW902_01820 [Syntrophaceae bacterium]|nr:hypothetical protein [Syntrophaceae bacterium]
MDILKKFSIFKEKAKKKSENLLLPANLVSSRIDKLAWDVFTTFRVELLAEPITCIVPAVWGAKKNGELTLLQQKIHSRIHNQIDEIFDLLGIKDLTDSQAFAVKYLIRDLLITKIVYMIESFRAKMDETSLMEERMNNYLKHIEPKGTA